MKKETKYEEEKGEGRAFKDEPGCIRDTIRQKDSLVDQLEKEKENLQSRLETEFAKKEEKKRGTELKIKRDTLEKDNDSTEEGHKETDLKEKEAVVVIEPVLKYKIPKK